MLRVDYDRGISWVATHCDPNLRVLEQVRGSDEEVHRAAARSHWTRTAVELLNTAPAFANQIRLCDAAFGEFVDWSLLEFVHGDVGPECLDRSTWCSRCCLR